MANTTDFLDPKDLSRLANHQVLARRVVEGFCSGLHRSPHKGFSVEFKQHRASLPAMRFADLTGRSLPRQTGFMWEYEEETNLRCHLLFDAAAQCHMEVMMKTVSVKLHMDLG